MEKFKKICFVIIAICILLLAFKALKQSNGETTQYFSDNLVMVEDGKIHEENNGKVVAIKGRLKVDGYVADERFAVLATNTPRLERKVLEYRYYDKETNLYSDTIDSSEPVERSSRWKKRWEDKGTAKDYIENDAYQLKEMINEVTRDSSIVDVTPERFTINPKLNGEIEIPEESLRKFPCNKPVTIGNGEDLPDKKYSIKDYDRSFTVKNNEYTTVEGGISEVGDLRVSFKCLDLEKLGEVTVVAKQEDGKLVEYKGENEDIVFEVYKGSLSREDILNKLSEEDKYAIIGVVITVIVLLIIGMVVFRDEIGSFMDKKNIHIELSENLLQGIVFVAFLLFFIGILLITINIVRKTYRAKEGIPVEATVIAFDEQYHGSQIGYYYTYEYIVDDEAYQREFSNTGSIPFDPSEETEDGEIAKMKVYYDKDDPAISYISTERSHNIMFYLVSVFFHALFILGMVKSASNIVQNNKKENK